MQRQINADARPLASEITRNRSTRHRIEDAIEALIAILDLVDGDSDNEHNGDTEPSLGWSATGAWGDISGRDMEAIHA